MSEDLFENYQYTAEDIAAIGKRQQLFQSATKRGLEFNLTVSDVKRLLKRKTCYYTRVKFEYNLPQRRKGKHNIASPYIRTIDRIDPTKGYVRGNVVACTWFINQVKNELFDSNSDDSVTVLKNFSYFLKRMEKVVGI